MATGSYTTRRDVTSRKAVMRGRPTFLVAGISGSTSAHSASRTSLAYLPPLRSYRGRVNSVQAIVISVQLGVVAALSR